MARSNSMVGTTSLNVAGGKRSLTFGSSTVSMVKLRDLDGKRSELFLSINGWSKNVVPLAKQNPAKSIILMEGFDLRTVLARPFDLRQLLKAKLRALNLDAEPYFPISKLL